jgi:hypothetical protein
MIRERSPAKHTRLAVSCDDLVLAERVASAELAPEGVTMV